MVQVKSTQLGYSLVSCLVLHVVELHAHNHIIATLVPMAIYCACVYTCIMLIVHACVYTEPQLYRLEMKRYMKHCKVNIMADSSWLGPDTFIML